MRDILISIQPQWNEKILNGEKIIEIRKTKPECKLPCKVHIYCTKDTKRILAGTPLVEKSWKCWNRNEWNTKEKKAYVYGAYNGKVIGEFVCDRIEDFSKWEYDYPSLLRHIDLYAGTNGDYKFLNDYLKGNKKGYGWHISDLKIYDKPKELNDFCKPCKITPPMCDDRCEYYSDYSGVCMNYVNRPPQSWCYVEELEEVK